MPTINKNDMLGSDANGILKQIESMMSELPGITTEVDSQSPSTFNVYFDGNKDTIFRISNAGTVGSYTLNMKIEICKKVESDSSYETVIYQTVRLNPKDSNHPSAWIREYISSSSAKDRLITISTGTVGKTGGDMMAQGYGYDGCIIVGEDSLGNVVYGIGASGIQRLYCPQTDTWINTNNMSFNNMAGPSYCYNTPIGSLGDKAYIVKAVNLCHPDLPEMKNFYTAVFRPCSRDGVLAAQRYYISGNMWGSIGSDQLACKCNYFDPMIQI